MKGLVLFEVGIFVGKYSLESRLEETSSRSVQCGVRKAICPTVVAVLVSHRRTYDFCLRRSLLLFCDKGYN